MRSLCKNLNVSASGYYDWCQQGSQYTSIAFGKRCHEMGVKPFMGTVGDAYDNAMAESFFASLECEVINRYSWKTKTEARLKIFTWIEAWYNPHRRHSGIDCLSPNNYERRLLQNQELMTYTQCSESSIKVS